MRSYEEMSKIVLSRIEQEAQPRWKFILSAILKRLLLAILVVIIVAALIVFLGKPGFPTLLLTDDPPTPTGIVRSYGDK